MAARKGVVKVRPLPGEFPKMVYQKRTTKDEQGNPKVTFTVRSVADPEGLETAEDEGFSTEVPAGFKQEG